MPETFVPDHFEPPAELVLPGMRLEPLGPAHNERDHEAWSSSDRNRFDVIEGGIRAEERLLDNAADIPDVLSRGELGHDAAPLPMDGGLRCHDVRPNRPGPRRVTGLGEHGGRGLVARCFDGEHRQMKFKG